MTKTLSLAEVREGDRVRVSTEGVVVEGGAVEDDNGTLVHLADGDTIELLERPKPEPLPVGAVFRDPNGVTRVITSRGWYNLDEARLYPLSESALGDSKDERTILFDPTDAEPIESPLREPGEIRVGDLVRRTRSAVFGELTVTVQFRVHRVEGGRIYPRYELDGYSPGLPYNPRDFERVPGEGQDSVPEDRLPAGAIIRSKATGNLHLRTATGFVALSMHLVVQETHSIERDLRLGRVELLYLPER